MKPYSVLNLASYNIYTDYIGLKNIPRHFAVLQSPPLYRHHHSLCKMRYIKAKNKYFLSFTNKCSCDLFEFWGYGVWSHTMYFEDMIHTILQNFFLAFALYNIITFKPCFPTRYCFHMPISLYAIPDN